MTPRRIVLFATVPSILIGACNHAAAPVPTVTMSPATPVASSTSTSQGANEGNVCKEIMHAQHDTVARAIAAGRAHGQLDWAGIKDDREIFALLNTGATGIACYPFRGGAWSIEFGDIAINTFPSLTIGGSLVPVARMNGERMTGESIPMPQDDHLFVKAAVSDWDGDGVPELWLDVEETANGGEAHAATILAIAHGAVVDYAPTSDIAMTGTPFDADGDGRLDLRTSNGLRIKAAVDCTQSGYDKSGDFIAHSQSDGTFSTTDAAAKNYARSWCPSAPARIASPREALCARLWASTPDAIAKARALVTACVPWDCERERQHKSQRKNATKDCTTRKDTFDQKVPFTLP